MHLQSDSNIATAGYFRLSWMLSNAAQQDASAEWQYQLQESHDPQLAQARTIYLGADLARVVSGKSNGDYFYRIRAMRDQQPVSGWSDIVKVHVAHHSLNRAMLFFAAGAFIFLALLGFILTRHNAD